VRPGGSGASRICTPWSSSCLCRIPRFGYCVCAAATVAQAREWVWEWLGQTARLVYVPKLSYCYYMPSQNLFRIVQHAPEPNPSPTCPAAAPTACASALAACRQTQTRGGCRPRACELCGRTCPVQVPGRSTARDHARPRHQPQFSSASKTAQPKNRGRLRAMAFHVHAPFMCPGAAPTPSFPHRHALIPTSTHRPPECGLWHHLKS
jgi:hypothetical protein